jgi:hypothetical protein
VSIKQAQFEVRTFEGFALPVTRIENFDAEKHIRSSFIKLLEYKKDEILGLEVGVYEGINSMYMLIAHHKLKMVLVDAWDNIVAYTGGPLQSPTFMTMVKNCAIVNLMRFGDRVNFTYKNSEESVEDVDDESFDYIYIDGDHTYEGCKRDMELWWPKVKEGGMLAGHDIAMPEVRQAVEEFVKENNIGRWERDRVETIKDHRSDWWILK